MKIKIDELKEISKKALKNIGFVEKDAETILNHVVTAELEGKKSHGIVRIVKLKGPVASKKLSLTEEDPEIIKETSISLHVDGKSKTGLVVVEWALNKAIEKAKTNMVCFVGTKNVGPVTGMIGYFAKKVTKENLILLGFNNGPSGLTPFGSRESLWGTNPFTVGIPTNNPELYRPIEELKTDVDIMIQELKNSKKQDGVEEIFYPGEKSGKTYLSNLEKGEVEIHEDLIKQINEI